MNIKRNIIAFVSICLAGACTASAPDHTESAILELQSQAALLPMPSVEKADGFAREYDEIRGGHASARSVDLCELAYFFDGGAGLYRVANIVGVAENADDGSKRKSAHTYVQFDLLEDWSGFAPARPIVRITGGPLARDLTQSFALSLRKGETVGLFLYSPLPGENKGYYRTNMQGIFRADAKSGYSNGVLFDKSAVPSEKLGAMVSELYAGLPRVIHRPPWGPVAVPRKDCALTVEPEGDGRDFDLDKLREQAPQVEHDVPLGRGGAE